MVDSIIPETRMLTLTVSGLLAYLNACLRYVSYCVQIQPVKFALHTRNVRQSLVLFSWCITQHNFTFRIFIIRELGYRAYRCDLSFILCLLSSTDA